MGKNIKWDFTTKCNLRCIHCLAGKNYFRTDVNEISSDEKLAIVANLAKANVTAITFLGGEPLVSKDIFPTAQYAASKGIAVTLVTNGTLLDEARISKVLEAGIQTITVSLDGASDTTHDQIRGKKSFERTVTNLGRLVSHVTRAGSGLKVKVNTVVSRINVMEIEKMFDLGRQLGVNELSFLALSEMGRASDHKAELFLTPPEMIEAAITIGRKFSIIDRALYPVITQQIARPLVCDYINQAYGVEMPKSNISNICCFAAISLGYVTPDGYLFPCDKIVSDNYIGHSIGGTIVERRSLLRHGLDDIWSSDYFTRMFELVLDDDTYARFDPCNSCKYLRTRECNPCPLFAHRPEGVSMGTCLIAQKALNGTQCSSRESGISGVGNILFSGFDRYRPDAGSGNPDLYGEHKTSIPSKATGLRSFHKNGAAVIFNPSTAEYCCLDAVGEFLWSLIDSVNSVGDIALEIEDVILQVRKRLCLDDSGSSLNGIMQQQVAAYFMELREAGYITMENVELAATIPEAAWRDGS